MSADVERHEFPAQSPLPTDSDKTHRVVVFARPDDAEEVHVEFVERLGWHSTDAQIAVRAMPGVLPEKFSAERAAEVVAALGSLGLTTAAMRNSEIPDLAGAETIHHLRCRDEGLELMDPCGRPQVLLAWPNVQLLSIGSVPLDPSRHYVVAKTAVIRAAPRAPHPSLVTASKSGLETWLFRKDPTVAYRIDHSQMNYEYLGDRKTGSAAQNFRLLVQDLVNHASDVWLTPAARAFLLHERVAGYEFRSSAELERDTVLHFLRMRLHLQQDRNDTATQSPSEHPLIRNLQNPQAYEHSVTDIRVIETHISWVLLTGRFAYKIKKPVTFPFVDFSTLERRRFYCQEELRLNGRLAPSLYQDVVPVTGTTEQPAMNGSGEPIEFAVQMRQFPQDALLSRVLQRDALLPADVDGLAREVARFHRQTDVSDPRSRFGTPESIHKYMQDNFRGLRDVEDAALQGRLDAIRAWSEAEFERLRREFLARQRDGFVRECHGDLHLGNMILEEEQGTRQITIFDGIDFNEDLRWIDVMSDVAFCVMDLADRGRRDFAHRFLNVYLETTGDYVGLNLLSFYLVYRALVRAKVADIRLHQPGIAGSEARRERRELVGYLDLAEQYTRSEPPRLFITHGPSGSGKTFGTQTLVETLGAVRVRSDVERKRLGGLEATADSESEIGKDLYTPDMTERTYHRLARLAETILQAGFSVVVDATFLKRDWRDEFRDLAKRLDVPFRILDFRAPRSTLERRVRNRREKQHDASEATVDVLVRQLQEVEPPGTDETAWTVVVDSDLLQGMENVLAALGK